MSNWLYLLNNGYTNFSVSHIQSLNDIGPISSSKNGMSLWMVWCNSWLLCLPKCTLLCLPTCIRLKEGKLIFFKNTFIKTKKFEELLKRKWSKNGLEILLGKGGESLGQA